MKFPGFRTVVVLGALLAAFSGAVHAQYVWLDEKGRRQYSDMPPPASVPTTRILKQPRSMPLPAPASAVGESKEGAAKPDLSLAEKDAEFRKRRMEQAEKGKKTAEEARVAAENKKRCERLREYRKTLEDGERVARRDKNGEREFLSDEERVREVRDTKRVLEDCK